MKAADFAYVTPKGESGRMSGLKAKYTLLFFYDPDCSNCRKFEKVFEEMPAFVEMVEEGTLCVLAVYPDENEEEWLVKSAHMPRGWIVGWNKAGDIRSRQLYDIHATPSLFARPPEAGDPEGRIDGPVNRLFGDTGRKEEIKTLKICLTPVTSSYKSMYNSGCRLFLLGANWERIRGFFTTEDTIVHRIVT